jgi:hypothetical protein
MIDRCDRTSGMIEELSFRVDAQHVKDRMMDITRPQWLFFGGFTKTICGADQSATLDSATGKEAEH